MNLVLAYISIVALATVVVGCQRSTEGGPGAVGSSAKKQVEGPSEGTFSLSLSPGSTTLEQGEAEALTVSIKRSDGFNEEVALRFDGMPKGVAVEPRSPVIAHGDTEAKLTIRADSDAALGDFKSRMIGHPTKGADSSNEMAISVETP